MRTGLILATVVALVVGASALALKKDDSPAGGSTQAQSGGFEKVTKVDIRDFKFLPPNYEVKVGGKVDFTNQDTAPHTATAKTEGDFDTGRLTKGQTKPVTFNETGTFNYFCEYHAFMTGKVKVVE